MRMARLALSAPASWPTTPTSTGSSTAVLVDDVSHGTLTLNADGSFDYTPAADWFGEDTFTYKADDGTALSNLATVTITVNSVNDAPVAVNDAYVVNEDGLLSSMPRRSWPTTPTSRAALLRRCLLTT